MWRPGVALGISSIAQPCVLLLYVYICMVCCEWRKGQLFGVSVLHPLVYGFRGSVSGSAFTLLAISLALALKPYHTFHRIWSSGILLSLSLQYWEMCIDYRCHGNPNAGPHDWAAGTLPTELTPSPWLVLSLDLM